MKPQPLLRHQRLTAAGRARLAAEILGVYVRVRLRMRRHEIRDLLGEIRASSPGGPVPDVPIQVGARLGRAVVRTLALVPTDARCLTRSVVLVDLLARRGISSTLVIGVATEDGFKAHAWVERDGRSLLAEDGRGFKRLVEL